MRDREGKEPQMIGELELTGVCSSRLSAISTCSQPHSRNEEQSLSVQLYVRPLTCSPLNYLGRRSRARIPRARIDRGSDTTLALNGVRDFEIMEIM